MLRRLQAIFYSLLYADSLRSGKFDRAIADLSRLIQINPNNPIAYNDRGVACQGAGDYRRSIDDFDKAIALNPRFTMAYHNRGLSWKFLGEFDRAIADHAEAIALFPHFADAYAELGVAHQCKLNFELSIEHLTTAITLAPKHPGYLKSRGLSFFYRARFKGAVVDLRASLDLASDPYALLFLYLSHARTGEGAGLEWERRAKKLRRDAWPAAIVDLYLGRLTIDSAFAAARSADERAEAQFYIGEWHLIRDNCEDARRALQAAVQACPTWFIEHTAAVAELKRLE